MLTAGWELSRGVIGEDHPPADPGAWTPAAAPGTVAGALSPPLPAGGYDAEDWWFRLRFAACPPADGVQAVLGFDGLATIADVYLNQQHVLHSESMFEAHELNVTTSLRAENELLICCRALAPRLRVRRKPRARWRTRVVAEGNLRFHRTAVAGRAPGFAPGPEIVGPWRPVWLEMRRGAAVEGLRVRARLVDGEGVVTVDGRLAAIGSAPLPTRLTLRIEGPGTRTERPVALGLDGDGARLQGAAAVTDPSLWWPHTHGEPVLYRVALVAGDQVLRSLKVGFRTLRSAADLEADGPDLQINGQRVFARGAVWMPPSLTAPHLSEVELRRRLTLLVDAGMNMVRLPGIGLYESARFHDLCDELGILVWQDFMFANLDYPESDEAFMAQVADEAQALLAALGHRPSLAVLCGGSEVAQQVAMLGLDPALADGPLYGELLPGVVARAGVDAPYIPSAPWGGARPFQTDRGVANYYGVGGYLRPLTDVRQADVRFAAECLALANVPDEEALTALEVPGGLSVTHPGWKAGVPRDAGTGWDFEDVSDHYLQSIYGEEPVALRRHDQDRYLELSRAVSGVLMAEVFGIWRAAGSRCRGGLVLWAGDLVPGAGWGLLDHRGLPKLALGHLRRALAPIAVWSTDEGLNGMLAHLANDGPEPVAARLRIALYADGVRPVGGARLDLTLEPHSVVAHDVEQLLGHFADVSWAYRFGPPVADVVVLTLEHDGPQGTVEPLSQHFRFPAGRPAARLDADELGLVAAIERTPDGAPQVALGGRRLLHGVRVEIPGWVADDDGFCVEPGGTRRLTLRATGGGDPGAGPIAGSISALNLRDRVTIREPRPDQSTSG